ncbi:hypothetical protein [Nocardioides furvisabuli]|uniref:hypothetical protein n=1 Tax=Nocardioides furvisabuli TaxID=375542 RepID=UPI001E3C123E|nr:hypothetical protein [Nocardioides furvisabuli]
MQVALSGLSGAFLALPLQRRKVDEGRTRRCHARDAFLMELDDLAHALGGDGVLGLRNNGDEVSKECLGLVALSTVDMRVELLVDLNEALTSALPAHPAPMV